MIVSRAWENVPPAAGWRDLTPEPLVKKTCVLPDSIMMLMSTSTLLNLMLTFFLSFRKGVFSSFLFLSYLFGGGVGGVGVLSLVFIHQAAAACSFPKIVIHFDLVICCVGLNVGSFLSIFNAALTKLLKFTLKNPHGGLFS